MSLQVFLLYLPFFQNLLAEDDIVFLILNKNETPISIDLNRFKELNLIGKTFQNVLKDEAFEWQETLKLSKKGSYIFSSTPK